MDTGHVVGIVVICIFVAISVICFFCFFLIFWCCVIRVKESNATYQLNDLEMCVNAEEKNKIVEKVWAKLHPSRKATSPSSCSSVSEKPQPSPDLTPEITQVEEIVKFNLETEGLATSAKESGLVDRHSSIKLVRTGDTFRTVSQNTSLAQQSYLSDQYETFNRTLMLQNLIEQSVNTKDTAIKAVRDRFSQGEMCVGGLVVVVTPFHGTEKHEFAYLETGDLLRVLKFYIRDVQQPDVSRRLHLNESKRVRFPSLNTVEVGIGEPGPNLEIIGLHDPNYSRIWGTGVLLRTYLEYNPACANFALRYREMLDDQTEHLRDFPLSSVTLETSVLGSLCDSPEVESMKTCLEIPVVPATCDF